MSLTETDRVAVKKKKKEIMRRRAQVLEMYNKGMIETEMAQVLGVDQSTISRDIRALSTKAANVFRDHWLEIPEGGSHAQRRDEEDMGSG